MGDDENSGHAAYLAEAVALSAESLQRAGTQPFGAVVVMNGRVVGRGLNQSTATFDPTSHGETEAIRDACRNLGTLDLTGATIYASCEPCPICRATIAATNIAHLYYAASLADSRPLMADVPVKARARTDIARMKAVAGGGGDLPVTHLPSAEAVDVIRRWAAANGG